VRIVIAVAVLALGSLVTATATAADSELTRIERQIWKDQRALQKLGIWLEGTNVDTDRDVVQVDVITRERDVKQVMADRYGPKVRVQVMANRRSRLIRTRWDSWAPKPGGKRIRIWWMTNSAFGLEKVRVREGRRRVVITVIERAPNGYVTMAGEYRNHLVRLRKPVWGREVIDGATGKKRPLVAGPGGP
jgi:hypothetical protein